ncbi:MAG: sugar MFS transporter [Ignavibacteriales bacterium]|nr:sugar MFS transporter [Ignavibacteriales bacterium]
MDFSRMFKTEDGKNYFLTFTLISTLFLLWGTCNGMIDVMDKHFQDFLHLSKAQSAWVQFAHYLGYLLMALPASWLARKLGYKGGIIAGLLLVSLGGFWFIPATHISAFWAFLFGVCLIAMGLTILETVANPYTTVLGPKKFAASRINLAQSFNGIGWIFGPIIGGVFFYSNEGAEAAQKQLYIPYMVVAIIVLVMAVIFYFANVPDLNTEDEYKLDDTSAAGTIHSIWSHPHFIGGVAAQFFYVAAQAGIFSFFINYMIEEIPSISQSIASTWIFTDRTTIRNGSFFLNEKGATFLLGTVGFPLFLIGRATGAAILKKLRAHRVLGTYALVNVFLCAVVVFKLGWLSVAAVFLSFLFMSIMFPTIFTLGIYGLGTQAKKASGFIVMAIIGGAIMPKLMGYLGDVYNMSAGFIMPMICFVIVSLYGFFWTKLSNADGLVEITTTRGH